MRFFLHFFYWILFFLLGQHILHAQTIETYNYNIKQDRSTVFFTSELLVDHQGFTWYTTENGLVKDFGGATILIEFPDFKTTNTPVRAHVVFQDNNRDIWISTDLGSYIINYKTHAVIKFNSKFSGKLKQQRHIAIAQRKNDSSIYINTHSNDILEFKNQKLINKYTTNVKEYKQGYLEVNSKNNLVFVSLTKVFTIKNNTLQFVCHKTPQDILISLKRPENSIQDCSGYIYYKDKRIPYDYLPEIDMYKIRYDAWGIDDSTFRYENQKSWTLKNNTITTYRDSKIWSQKFEYYNTQWHLKDVFKTDVKTEILTILNYKANEYILSGDGNELHKIRVKENYYKSQLQDSITPISTRAIFSDTAKKIFVASYSGLFTIDTLGTETLISKNRYTKTIYPILQKNDSIVWMGSGMHLSHFNFKTNTFNRILLKENTHLNILSLSYKNDSEFWVGTTNGLYLFKENTKKFSKNHTLNNTYNLKGVIIKGITQFKNNWVWLATNNGIYAYNYRTKEVTHYSNTSKTYYIPHSFTYHIHKDKYNTIWITGNQGLSSIAPNGDMQHYSEVDGLANNVSTDIIETQKHLWLSTNDGVSRLNLKGDKKQFSNYLKGVEFNLKSHHKLNDSILYFGSMTGIYRINTKKLPKQETNQYLVPVSLKSYNKAQDSIIEQYKNINDLKAINLTHDKNYFELKFAINNSFNHAKNHYLYTIEGLTDSWIPLDNTAIIRQYGINPGNYTLKIKGKNEAGLLIKNDIVLPIHVSQVFYKTTWFILGLMGLTLGVIALILYRTRKRIKKESYLKREIKTLNIKALTMQMNPHFIFNIINNLQSDLILKNTENINDYIHAFSSLLRTTMNMTRAHLISVKDEISYLTSYIKLQQYRLNHSFLYEIKVIDNDKNLREIDIPCMLLQPIIENAILHGLEPKIEKDKELHIVICVKEKVVEISIEDNGVGRPQKQKEEAVLKGGKESHAMGLMKIRVNLRNEIARNKMTMQVIDLKENNIPVGTKVVFEIPYKY